MREPSDTVRISLRTDQDYNSDSESFYRNYWTDASNIDTKSIQIKANILNYFFAEGITGKSILEIGVGGEGGLIINLAAGNRVHGVDVSDSAGRNCARMGLPFTKVNLDRQGLPFADGHFDVVFALEVFEHFANPQFALEEIKRVLKDNGILLVSAPTQWCHHWPRLFYPSLFKQENFTEFLMINGFEAKKVENWFIEITHNKDLRIPAEMKTWNWFWIAEKVGKTDSASFFELGMYFWNKLNEFGIRESPLEALDLFRISFNIDGNKEARLAMTHALLYRFLYNDGDEFLSECKDLLEKTSGVMTCPIECDYSLTFVKIIMEADRFGHRLVNDATFGQLKKAAQRTPTLEQFLKDICYEQ